jgi:hypothetical protein
MNSSTSEPQKQDSIAKEIIKTVKKHPIHVFATLVGMGAATIADMHGVGIKENIFLLTSQFCTASLISSEAVDNVIGDKNDYIKNTLHSLAPEKNLLKSSFAIALASGVAYAAAKVSNMNIAEYAFVATASGAGFIAFQAGVNTLVKKISLKKIEQSGLSEEAFWDNDNQQKSDIIENVRNKIVQHRDNTTTEKKHSLGSDI